MADLPGNYAIPASCASLAMPGLTCLARRFWAALTAAEPAGGMRPGLSEIPLILVIGAQKIVSDVATGMRRIHEYCDPLEDARARQTYGVPSGVNNILIINKVMTPGRVTAIIVKERLGF